MSSVRIDSRVIASPSHDLDTPHDEQVSEDEPPNEMPCGEFEENNESNSD
jgi:hypothetical protein